MEEINIVKNSEEDKFHEYDHIRDLMLIRHYGMINNRTKLFEAKYLQMLFGDLDDTYDIESNSDIPRITPLKYRCIYLSMKKNLSKLPCRNTRCINFLDVGGRSHFFMW